MGGFSASAFPPAPAWNTLSSAAPVDLEAIRKVVLLMGSRHEGDGGGG